MLWAAKTERRVRKVAEGKIDLIDADEAQSEIAERLV